MQKIFKYIIEKLDWFMFRSNWEKMHIDKIILVMYGIPIVLYLCNTVLHFSNSASMYSEILTPLCQLS